jgi:flagellar hook-length control protein FliK
VIQLFPPIQSVESSEVRQSQSTSLSQDHEKLENKEGGDVFAKLLAGLLQKSGKPRAEQAVSYKEGHEIASVEVPSLAENAGEAAEVFSGEALRNLDSPQGGKKLKVSQRKDSETVEEHAKTGVLSDVEKKRVKSHSIEQQSAETALAADVRFVPEAGDRMLEGEEVISEQAFPGGVLLDKGEEALESAVFNRDDAVVSYTFVEAADQGQLEEERPGMGKRDLSAGEFVRDVGESLSVKGIPMEMSGSGRNVRLPGRETSETDGRSPGEVRVKDRRRDRAGSEAGDMRAGLDKRDGAESLRSLAEAGKGEDASFDKGREQNFKEQSSTELTVELRSLGKTQSEISAERENRPIQSFQNTLARELHENLNGDIVRHASVMLRDSGEGTIRLSLKPETLGTVKIRLEIAENKVTGRITVESGEAFRAFEQELHSLEQSFCDSGFDGANLEMAFASDGKEGRGNGADNLFSGRRIALSYDAVLSESQEEGQWLGVRLDNQEGPLVNMLV